MDSQTDRRKAYETEIFASCIILLVPVVKIKTVT